MVRVLLLFLLLFFLVRFVWRLVGGIVEGATSTGPAERRGRTPGVKMQRDPVCGTFVVPGKALELARGRETVYFCSDTCRDQYLARS